MRVLFLTHNYPRWPGDPAGAFLATLATALVRRGADVTVVTPSDRGRAGEETGRDGVRVRRVRYAAPENERFAYGGMLEGLRNAAGLWALVQMWRSLRGAAKAEVKRGVDVIHAHWWVPAGLAAPSGAPMVVTSHGSDAALLVQSGAARALARTVYRRAAVVTAVSNEVARWIGRAVGREIPPQHIQPMPVDTSKFQRSCGGGGAIVVSRLTRQKRVHLAIGAIARLHARGVELKLTIVGDGPERPALEQLAAERGVAKLVRFVGAVAPDEVPRFLATADVMLFPAEREGFGLGAAEALLAGVPVVVCSDGGGVLDVVPASGAGRHTPPEAEALSDGVLDVLRSPTKDADLRIAENYWRRRLDADYAAAVCERWYVEASASALPARRP